MKLVRLGARAPALALLAGCASSASPSESEQSVSTPIIDGYLNTAAKGVVAFAVQDRDQVEVFCGSSLCAPNLVLTARHCIAQIGGGSSEQVDCSTSQFATEYDPSAIALLGSSSAIRRRRRSA